MTDIPENAKQIIKKLKKYLKEMHPDLYKDELYFTEIILYNDDDFQIALKSRVNKTEVVVNYSKNLYVYTVEIILEGIDNREFR